MVMEILMRTCGTEDSRPPARWQATGQRRRAGRARARARGNAARRAGSGGGRGSPTAARAGSAARRGRPSRAARRRGSGPARPPSARACRDGAGAAKSASVGPISTMRPRYITATRSQMCRTTRRSCEMKSRSGRARCCRSSSRLRICACTETSSAETGSSATMQLGLERQRAGDADALALAAGELVRVAARGVAAAGRPVEQLAPRARRRSRRRRGRARASGSPSDVARRVMRGLSEPIRVLEDHLHAAAVAAAASPPASAGTSVPSKRIAPGVGLDAAARGSAAERGLAAAGFAHEPERLAARDLEGDAVDARRTVAGRRREQAARAAGSAWSRPSTSRSGSRAHAAAPPARAGASRPRRACAAGGERGRADRDRGRRALGRSAARRARSAARSGSPAACGRGVGHGCPGWARSALARPARRAASSASRPACTDGAGARRRSHRRRSPPRGPAYITTTRSQVSATTPRSWVIEHIAMPCSR